MSSALKDYEFEKQPTRVSCDDEIPDWSGGGGFLKRVIIALKFEKKL